MRQFAVLILIFMTSFRSNGQVLASTDFSTAGFNEVIWQSQDNVHAICPILQDFTHISNQEYSSSNIVTGQEINPFRYFTMKVGIDGCNLMHIDSLRWQAKHYGIWIVDAPFHFHLRSSLDDFNSDLAVYTPTSEWQWMSYYPSESSMDSLHSIEFRIYFSDAQILINTWESSNSLLFDNFYVYGFQSNSDTITYYYDGDGDNYGDPLYSYHDCNYSFPYCSLDSMDCDPNNTNINPATVWMRDYDQDGYYNYFDRQQSCEQSDLSYILVYTNPMDCDDSAAYINFDAYDDPCPDNLDANCDGSDQGTGIMPHCNFHMDSDGDGYGNGMVNNLPCCPGYLESYLSQGYVVFNGIVDCDDDNAMIYPGAVEILGNDVDENCDGSLLIGIEEEEMATFVLEANPSFALNFSSTVTIDFSQYLMTITDMSCRNVFVGSVLNFLNNNLSHAWETGCYFIQISNGEVIQSLKWLKQ